MARDRAKILIVEDDPAIQEMLAFAIAQATGRAAILASDGFEALNRAAADPPAVVVLDMRLPDIDGPEVARRLKADPQTASAAIIGMSASFQAARALAAGCDHFLEKPFSLHQLVDLVESSLAMVEGVG